MTQLLDLAPRRADVRDAGLPLAARSGRGVPLFRARLVPVLLVALLLAAAAVVGALTFEACESLAQWIGAEAVGVVGELRAWLRTPQAW